MKLVSKDIKMFVFSGTGNTMLIAHHMAEYFKSKGVSVSIDGMEKPCPPLAQNTAVALFFPIAFCSTYPTVWRFVKSLPYGNGKETFFVGTMGGTSLGMMGTMKEEMQKKGYKPLASKCFLMPSNYNNKTMPVQKNSETIAKAKKDADIFADNLLSGKGTEENSIPLLSSVFRKLADTRHAWNLFYKMFPFEVDKAKCTKCDRCASQCPEGALKLSPYPVLNKNLCQSCQRCVGFCPAGALHVPSKPAVQYSAMPFDEFVKR